MIVERKPGGVNTANWPFLGLRHISFITNEDTERDSSREAETVGESCLKELPERVRE